MAEIDDAVLALMVEALKSADDALDCLHRGHGPDVTNHCYPAKNLVYQALGAYASGHTDGEPHPRDIWPDPKRAFHAGDAFKMTFVPREAVTIVGPMVYWRGEISGVLKPKRDK